MKLPSRVLKWLLIGGFTTDVLAAEIIVQDSHPTLDLLEYLGSMVEDENGELIGPDNLDDESGREPIEVIVDNPQSDSSADEWLTRD